MPNRPSALKRLRQDSKRRQRNKAIKHRLRTEENKFDRLLQRRDAEAAEQQVRVLTKLYQRAARKNVLHKNKAARKQGQFRRRVNALNSE